AQFPRRMRIIDSTGAIADIQRQLALILDDLLELSMPSH
ncbi:MAG TPA: dTMP kinase, partial [Janthinobacterium sp.]|nr:dTMP kinase [Janthinobacterium sp.]